MTTPQPIHPEQPPVEDLRNALQILDVSDDVEYGEDFRAVVRLIRHALEGLGEPNAAAKKVAEQILRAAMGGAYDLLPGGGERWVRDTVSVIVRAQVTGLAPETL